MFALKSQSEVLRLDVDVCFAPFNMRAPLANGTTTSLATSGTSDIQLLISPAERAETNVDFWRSRASSSRLINLKHLNKLEFFIKKKLRRLPLPRQNVKKYRRIWTSPLKQY